MKNPTQAERKKSLRQMRAKTPLGAAKVAWLCMNSRINAARRGEKHYAAYVGIEIRLTRDEFLAWAGEEYAKWMAAHPGEPPSLDRIDSRGHYEIGNLQVISRAENSRKSRSNRHLAEGIEAGKKRCGRCQVIKDFSEFRRHAPRSRGSFGLFGWCRKCAAHNQALRLRAAGGRKKQAARKAVGRALKTGRLIKPACCGHEGCDETYIEAHHCRGYEREHWLDVEWLCHSHHRKAHRTRNETVS